MQLLIHTQSLYFHSQVSANKYMQLMDHEPDVAHEFHVIHKQINSLYDTVRS